MSKLDFEPAARAPIVEGNYLIIAVPIYQGGALPHVNQDGIIVGDSNKWERISWDKIIDIVYPEDLPATKAKEKGNRIV